MLVGVVFGGRIISERPTGRPANLMGAFLGPPTLETIEPLAES